MRGRIRRWPKNQKGKTIYPLYIRKCELHSRFRSRNYIDARDDLQGALDRLLRDLRHDFPGSGTAPGEEKPGASGPAEVSPNGLPEALQSLLDKIRSGEGIGQQCIAVGHRRHEGQQDSADT